MALSKKSFDERCAEMRARQAVERDRVFARLREENARLRGALDFARSALGRAESNARAVEAALGAVLEIVRCR